MVFDLRKRRKQLGYSVEKLAEKADVSITTIKNIEGKKHKPRRETLELIFTALKLDITCDEYYLSLSVEKDNLEGEDNSDQNAKSKLAEADRLFDEEKYEESLKIYLSLATIYEKGKYLYGCALAYYMLGKYEDCLNYCEKLLDYPSYEYEALVLKGECLGNLSRRREAIETFEKAVEIEEEGEIYYNIGVCYYEENNLDDAIKYYEKSIELLPDFVSSYINLAVCYSRKFRIEEGMKYAKKAIEINPHMYEPYATLGSCYRELGQYEDAVENYKKCLELDDENYEALYGIFMSLFTLSNKENSDKVDKYKKEAEFYSEKFFRIHGDKFLGTKKEKKDRTYVGYTHLTDETGSLDYPTLGKIYENRDKYLEDIENIKKAVDVFQYFDKPIYHTLDYVNVNVVKLDKSTVLEMVFGDFRIVDINSHVKDLDKFRKLYKKFNQFRIQLQYKDEFFIIDCLRNISIIN